MNDNDERPVTIITGRVWRRKGGQPEGVHIMLVAPDDDSAVRSALEALAKEGYAEAELDQIGVTAYLGLPGRARRRSVDRHFQRAALDCSASQRTQQLFELLRRAFRTSVSDIRV